LLKRGIETLCCWRLCCRRRWRARSSGDTEEQHTYRETDQRSSSHRPSSLIRDTVFQPGCYVSSASTTLTSEAVSGPVSLKHAWLLDARRGRGSHRGGSRTSRRYAP